MGDTNGPKTSHGRPRARGGISRDRLLRVRTGDVVGGVVVRDHPHCLSASISVDCFCQSLEEYRPRRSPGLRERYFGPNRSLDKSRCDWSTERYRRQHHRHNPRNTRLPSDTHGVPRRENVGWDVALRLQGEADSAAHVRRKAPARADATWAGRRVGKRCGDGGGAACSEAAYDQRLTAARKGLNRRVPAQSDRKIRRVGAPSLRGQTSREASSAAAANVGLRPNKDNWSQISPTSVRDQAS